MLVCEYILLNTVYTVQDQGLYPYQCLYVEERR
jgi:hypothetical protein